MTGVGFETALAVLLAGVLASVFAALARVVVGPSLPDRVVAFDLVTVLAVAFTGLVAWRFQAPALLDMAIVLALVAFIATIAFADHLIRRDPATQEDPQASREATGSQGGPETETIEGTRREEGGP